uniref:Uncharacterized protein n=1 Tax=Glossina palpalis gambiensis TaxID=67801 RepID=A0A1B0AV18_9MUSC
MPRGTISIPNRTYYGELTVVITLKLLIKKKLEVNSTTVNYSIDEEYKLICEKIKPPKTPNKKVILGTLCSSLQRSSFKYREGTVTFTRYETVFMQENFLNEPTFSAQKQFIVYAKDLIRRKFALVDNVCSITYTSHNWNSTNFKLCIYAKCIYFYNGCKKYKIVYKPLLHQFDVFSNCENLTHPVLEYKIPQVRGKQRNIAKMTLKDQKAAKWRDIYLCKQDYIQKISYSLEIYLFSLSQLTLIQKLNPHTLFMDATGNVIKKISFNSKRIFMYSIIAHVQREENETGILFPLCESFLSRHFSIDIERFLIYVKTFCKDNNLRWPICQRIISDWSMALITAILWANRPLLYYSYVQIILSGFCIDSKKPTSNSPVE